jgi:hypothetical protein
MALLRDTVAQVEVTLVLRVARSEIRREELLFTSEAASLCCLVWYLTSIVGDKGTSLR